MIDLMRKSREGRTFVTCLTDRGELTGVLYSNHGSRHLVVEHLSSGSLITVPSENARPATDEEIERMWQHVQWAEKLHESERTIVDGMSSTENDSRSAPLLQMATSRGMFVAEAGGFYKVMRNGRGPALYLSRNCRRIDLAGFSVEHPLLYSVDEAEARWRRLGRVRAQALNIPPDSLESLWVRCLDALPVS